MTTERPLTDDEAAAEMLALRSFDTEGAHSEADHLLCRLLVAAGYPKTVEIFNDMDKWYA